MKMKALLGRYSSLNESATYTELNVEHGVSRRSLPRLSAFFHREKLYIYTSVDFYLQCIDTSLWNIKLLILLPFFLVYDVGLPCHT